MLADHLIGGGDADLRASLRHCVTNMVLRFAFGTRVPYDMEASSKSPFGRLLQITNAIWSDLNSTPTFVSDLMGVPQEVPMVRGRLRRNVERRDRLLADLISERRAVLDSRVDVEEAGDMLDVLLASGLPDEDMLYTLVDLFVAGVGTVSTALEWTLLLTAAHPLEQERARSATLRSRVDGVASPRISALTNEVLRAKPPLLIPRRALRDSSISGFHVPAGQVVYANHFALTHSERHWVQPSAFRPERWLQEEAGFDSLRGVESCKFIPFSVGRRACPGALLAEAELRVVTETLLRRVRWSRTSPIDLREDYGLTLSPLVKQRLQFSRIDARPARPASHLRRTMDTQMCATRDAVQSHTDRRRRPMESSSSKRSTRRQRLDYKEAVDVSEERFREAGEDRRGGWRASKAKGHRRNRRYQNRLLQGLKDTEHDYDEYDSE